MAEVRNNHPDISVEDMASSLYRPDSPKCDLSKLPKAVDVMLSNASRYKNLEQSLEVPGGVLLVLGSRWAESS